jgi:hypothetical protein
MTQIVRAPVRSSLQVGLGQSNDKLEILYGGVASSLTVSGGVTLDGGNDELILGVQRGGMESIIDGGPGFDIGFGPGRIVNCEIIN